ncbi:MAG TPA: ATP-binding protein [Silvibacterium sp.]|nr:ATP-binding protein [Silvibacterium sp.]
MTVTWVMLAGLPGTGKSTLARALANRLNGAVLDKDKVRDALFPGAMTDYTREQDDLCVHAMLAAAAYLTERQRVDFVFIDGRTFSKRDQIDEVVQAAERAGARWRILHVTCSDAVAEARLSRSDAENPAKNRNVALYRQVKENFEPIEYPKIDVDTTEGVDQVVDSVRERLQA